VTVVVAAGNDMCDATVKEFCPAHIDAAITVSSFEKNDTPRYDSNYGSCVDVGAPGADINSTIPGGGFGLKSGTSMAAPHVAGAVAMLLCDADIALFTPKRVHDLIRSCVDPIGTINNRYYGTGILNLKKLNVGSMSLVTAKASVSFVLRGSGSAVVSWGDGSSNTYTLSSSDYVCTHSYASSVSRTITIMGTAITGLKCNDNQLTTLTVTGNTVLETLYCQNNQLTSLSISKLSKLNYLCCQSNSLSSLSFSENTALETLLCANNQLSSLSVSGLPKLRYLNCYSNRLTSLDVSGLSNLSYLECRTNNISGTALDNLFKSLNATSGITKLLYILGNPGIASCNTTIATNKNWTVDYQPTAPTIDLTHGGISGFSFGQSQDQLKRFQTFYAKANQPIKGVDLKLRKVQGTTQSDVVVELYTCYNHKPTGSPISTATISSALIGTTWVVVHAPLVYPTLLSGQEYAIVLTQRTLSGQALYEWATSQVSTTTFFGKWNGSAWIDESGLGDDYLKVWLGLPYFSTVDVCPVAIHGNGFGNTIDEIKRYETFTLPRTAAIIGIDLMLRKFAGLTQSEVVADLYATSGNRPTGGSLASGTILASKIGSDWTIVHLALKSAALPAGKYALVLSQRTLSSARYEWGVGKVSVSETFGKWNGTGWIDESGLGAGWIRVLL
jgi:hypothetical protein